MHLHTIAIATARSIKFWGCPSVTNRGKFFKFGTNIYFDLCMNWLKFGDQRLKFKIKSLELWCDVTLFCKNKCCRLFMAVTEDQRVGRFVALLFCFQGPNSVVQWSSVLADTLSWFLLSGFLCFCVNCTCLCCFLWSPTCDYFICFTCVITPTV